MKIHGNINLDGHLPKLNLLSCPCFSPSLLFISSFFIWVLILIGVVRRSSICSAQSVIMVITVRDSFLLWASAPVNMELEITFKHHSLWPLLFLQWFSDLSSSQMLKKILFKSTYGHVCLLSLDYAKVYPLSPWPCSRAISAHSAVHDGICLTAKSLFSLSSLCLLGVSNTKWSIAAGKQFTESSFLWVSVI